MDVSYTSRRDSICTSYWAGSAARSSLGTRRALDVVQTSPAKTSTDDGEREDSATDTRRTRSHSVAWDVSCDRIVASAPPLCSESVLGFASCPPSTSQRYSSALHMWESILCTRKYIFLTSPTNRRRMHSSQPRRIAGIVSSVSFIHAVLHSDNNPTLA